MISKWFWVLLERFLIQHHNIIICKIECIFCNGMIIIRIFGKKEDVILIIDINFSSYRFGIVKLIELLDKIFPVFYGNNNREVLRRHCRSPVEAVGNIRQVVLFAIVVEIA